ncbi:MAG: CHASE2 domain-containing protein [Candidatus Omnitrophota bacterium]
MPELNSKTLALLVIIFLSVSAVSFLRIFDSFELNTLDARFRARPVQPVNKDIAIIEIADDTLDKIGEWPIDRRWHAELVKALGFFGARAVVFDIIFSEPSIYDEEFTNAIAGSGEVYLPCVFELEKIKGKLLEAKGYVAGLVPKFRKAAKRTGHINIVPDIDGKNRKVPFFIEYQGKVCPHVALWAACDYLGVTLEKARASIPLYDGDYLLINFAGPWVKTYPHFSYIDVIKSYAQAQKGLPPTTDVDKLKGKVCFVGLTATGTHDLNPSPLEVRYPGVGIHADLFNTVVEQHFLKRAGRFTNIFALLLLSACVILVTIIFSPAKGFTASAGFIVFYCVLCFALFIYLGVWLDLFYPIIVAVASYASLTAYRFISEKKKRLLIENEVKLAKRIQESFLPQELPKIPGIEIAALMLPAHGVAGDMYDFIEHADSLGVMIGDVSGKGVPAALFMAKTVSEFKFFAKTQKEPDIILSSLNEQMVNASKTGLFVTMLYIDVNPGQFMLEIANGGHMPLLLLSKDSDEPAEITTKEGLPLGLMSNVVFDKKSLTLKPGDVMILYTDGITESQNIKKEEFGKERLIGLLKDSKSLSPREIIERLKLEIGKFARWAPQHDDITIIVVKLI